MSTNSRIGIEMANGRVQSVYCHWDGYPKGVGQVLIDHYGSREKVGELIGLGSISSLGPEVSCPEGHTFETPVNGHTVAHHRDRGDDYETRTDDTVEDYRKSDIGEFAYLYTRAGEWCYINGWGEREIRSLEAALSLAN